MRDEAGPWNHNLHYHPVILRAIPRECTYALDVGCGEGVLTRRLRRQVPQVTGVWRKPG
jgi:predicted TPR repeat methyltransferase